MLMSPMGHRNKLIKLYDIYNRSNCVYYIWRIIYDWRKSSL